MCTISQLLNICSSATSGHRVLTEVLLRFNGSVKGGINSST